MTSSAVQVQSSRFNVRLPRGNSEFGTRNPEHHSE